MARVNRASVPTRIGRWMSARWAVSLFRGSMTMRSLSGSSAIRFRCRAWACAIWWGRPAVPSDGEQQVGLVIVCNGVRYCFPRPRPFTQKRAGQLLGDRVVVVLGAQPPQGEPPQRLPRSGIPGLRLPCRQRRAARAGPRSRINLETAISSSA